MDTAIVALVLAALPAVLGASNLLLLPRARGVPGERPRRRPPARGGAP